MRDALKNKKKTCTVGSATQDMFILYEGADVLHLHQKNSSYTYMLLEQGAKIDVPAIHYAAGGGATNAAVGLQKMGLEVEAFFRTGNDPAGLFLRKIMQSHGIKTDHCPIDTVHNTALSIIIPSIEQDHAALCYRAANRQQRKEDFPLALLKDLDLLFIGPLGGQSRELLPFLAPAASNAGAIVAINPSSQQLTKDIAQLIQTLQHVAILVINTRESGLLMQGLLKESQSPCFAFLETNGPALLTPYLSFGSMSFTISDVMKQILACGPDIVIITNGAEGVYLATEDTLYFHPSIATDPVYSLGAGDAFTSGFLGSYLHHIPLDTALINGIVNASSVIQYPDAKEGLLSFDEIMEQTKRLEPALYCTSFSHTTNPPK